jgi:arylsulfatase A-like enzyme
MVREAAEGETVSDSPPNLLFVFGDQWRRQAVGCMHADPVFTPNMDRFASEGMLFENAVSCSPLCTPNRAALLTGRHPFSLGMMHNWLRLPVEEETIATVAARAGYDTGYIGKWHLDAFEPGDKGDYWNCQTPSGPRRMGFRFWHAHGCNHKHFIHNYITTDDRIVTGRGWQVDYETDVALRYIENPGGEFRPADRPFCLFLSWSPPHNLCGGPGWHRDRPGPQFRAPARFEQLYRERDLPVRPNARDHADRYLEAATGYFGSVSSMDENFGRLLDVLDGNDLAEDTIVVLTSDHGEMLQSHGRWLKDTWHEESIGIPFLVRWPERVPAGRRETMLLNTPDIMPSLLALMGCPVPPGRHGADFSGVLLGRETAAPPFAFLSYNSGAPEPGMTPYEFPDERGRYWRGLRSTRYTYAVVDNTDRSAYHGPDPWGPRFPDGVSRVLLDNLEDPYQLNPVYPGQGRDDVMDELHAALAGWLQSLGDPFLEKYAG